MNIDWSNAPEGFPLWLEGTNEDHRKHSGWYRRAGQVFEGAHGGQWRAVREGQFFTVYCKPESNTWTGEGLPPLGTVCECNLLDPITHKFKWVSALIIYHNAATECAVKYNSRLFWCDEFRPARTEEQNAAEARLAELNEMVRNVKDHPSGRHGADHLTQLRIQEEACIDLYDAGWRKQVKQ